MDSFGSVYLFFNIVSEDEYNADIFKGETEYWNMELTSVVLQQLTMSALGEDYVWNVMTHAQKPDFVFRRNRRVHLNRRVRQFSRLLAAEVCASAAVMLDTPCSEVVRRVLATHSIRQFPLHLPSRASPCAIMFQLDSTVKLLISAAISRLRFTGLSVFRYP
jgi:hypothetical protein